MLQMAGDAVYGLVFGDKPVGCYEELLPGLLPRLSCPELPSIAFQDPNCVRV